MKIAMADKHVLELEVGSAFDVTAVKQEKEIPKEDIININKEQQPGDVARTENTVKKCNPYYNYEGGVRNPPAEKTRELEKLPPNVPPELIPPNAVDITKDKTGKLWKVLLEPGEENETRLPRAGNRAWIQYKCWFANDPDKKVFDSSSLCSEDDEAVCLNIGKQQVIRAIDVGIRTMTKRGEKALFIAHYDYAYGKKSSCFPETSNIPNGSFISAEVTLVDIEDAAVLANSFAQGTTREIIKLGEVDEASPPLTSNSVMFVKLEGYKIGINEEEELLTFLPETVFPFTPCFRTWGYNSSGKVTYPMPYELGSQLLALRTGDQILFTFSKDSAFPEDFHWNGIFIKAGEPVKYLVTVEEVEELNDPFMLSLKEKVDYCKKLIDQGILYDSKGWYEASASKFTRVREYLWEAKIYLKKVPRDLGSRCDGLLYFALCKLASLFWHMPEMEDKEAVKYCSDAIKVLESMEGMAEALEYGDSTQAYQLRARLYADNLKEYGLAKSDLNKILELTEKTILQTKLQHDATQKMMEMNLSDDQPNQGGENSKMHLEKTIKIKTTTLAQLKKIEELEKTQKTFVLKYVPPK